MIHSPLFSLYYLKAETQAFAVVASKKVSKKAVVRNRNKRRVRDILRKQPPFLFPGSYIVFIKKDLVATPHPLLKDELLLLLTKAK